MFGFALAKISYDLKKETKHDMNIDTKNKIKNLVNSDLGILKRNINCIKKIGIKENAIQSGNLISTPKKSISNIRGCIIDVNIKAYNPHRGLSKKSNSNKNAVTTRNKALMNLFTK
jgi:hypothetical protein